MTRNLLMKVVCFLLTLLFTYAAFSKLFNYTEFKAQLGNSPFITPVAGVLAWLIPIVELVIAIMLTVNNTRLTGFYSSFLILLIFTLYITAMLIAGVRLPCSCGGVIRQLNWKQHVGFNLFFILLALIGILSERKQKMSQAI
jgi:uncharacterized membrane protein YphA (DoxX/SURF4 family)